jgi:hypothetical protein
LNFLPFWLFWFNFKVEKPVFPAKTTLTFLKMDPNYATLGFINIAALEFIYKARKKSGNLNRIS